HGLPGDRRRSARACLLRRPPHPGDASCRCAERLELELLGDRPAARGRGARLDGGASGTRRAGIGANGPRRRDGRRTSDAPGRRVPLYVIAVPRAQATSRVRFTGLPAAVHTGEVLFGYADSASPSEPVPTLAACHTGSTGRRTAATTSSAARSPTSRSRPASS